MPDMRTALDALQRSVDDLVRIASPEVANPPSSPAAAPAFAWDAVGKYPGITGTIQPWPFNDRPADGFIQDGPTSSRVSFKPDGMNAYVCFAKGADIECIRNAVQTYGANAQIRALVNVAANRNGGKPYVWLNDVQMANEGGY